MLILIKLKKNDIICNDRITDKNICPVCKSKNVRKKEGNSILRRFVYMMLGLLFPMFEIKYHCYDCGK
jgi:hypothetical protein